MFASGWWEAGREERGAEFGGRAQGRLCPHLYACILASEVQPQGRDVCARLCVCSLAVGMRLWMGTSCVSICMHA